MIEVQEESYEIYGVYHIVCAARILRDSSDVVQEPLTRKSEKVSIRDSVPVIEGSPLSTREDLIDPYGER